MKIFYSFIFNDIQTPGSGRQPQEIPPGLEVNLELALRNDAIGGYVLIFQWVSLWKIYFTEVPFILTLERAESLFPRSDGPCAALAQRRRARGVKPPPAALCSGVKPLLHGTEQPFLVEQ